MTDKQLRQAIINPTQILVSDGVNVESNLGYFNLGATGRDLLASATQAEALSAIGAEQEIEIITNANGTAWRFSGGLQICRFVGASLPIDGLLSNGIYISQIFTWTFPAAFNSRPTALCQPGDARRWAGTDVSAGNGVSCTYRQLAPYLDPVLYPSYLFAIGTYTP